jgi:hypothetical protein
VVRERLCIPPESTAFPGAHRILRISFEISIVAGHCRQNLIQWHDTTRLVNLYFDADIFAFPPVWNEGFGLPPVEAMAAGTPVVASQRKLARCSQRQFVGLALYEFVQRDVRENLVNRSPDLADADSQRFYDAAIEDAELIIVDNLSTICRAVRENEADSWGPVQAWARRRPFFIHTSRRQKWRPTRHLPEGRGYYYEAHPRTLDATLFILEGF